MYRVTRLGSPLGELLDTPGQALRAMARAVRQSGLSDIERKAFDDWYSPGTYRAMSQCLRAWQRLEIDVTTNGNRQTYGIEHLPTLPQDPVERVTVLPVRHASGRLETPD